jgi:predicted nucleic acid-binding protein
MRVVIDTSVLVSGFAVNPTDPARREGGAS